MTAASIDSKAALHHLMVLSTDAWQVSWWSLGLCSLRDLSCTERTGLYRPHERMRAKEPEGGKHQLMLE